MEKESCQITKKQYNKESLIEGASIKRELIALIKKDFPDFSSEKYISFESLSIYRKKYLVTRIKKEHRELNHLEKEVLHSIEKNQLLSEKHRAGNRV